MAVRLEDVAVAGVSIKTVSNVIHDYPHVSSRTRERVQQAIDDLGYRPNVLGRRLATGRTGLIALAFADVSVPYFSELARVVSAAASERGYRPLLELTGGTLQGERAVVSSSEAGLVDGVIFQPCGHVLQGDRPAPRRRSPRPPRRGRRSTECRPRDDRQRSCRSQSDTPPHRPGQETHRVRRPRGASGSPRRRRSD